MRIVSEEQTPLVSEEQTPLVSEEQTPLTDCALSHMADARKNSFPPQPCGRAQASSPRECLPHTPSAQPDFTEDQKPRKRVRTLLLVDDEENILRALKRVLRGDDYQILTATSAPAACVLLGQYDVQVIVSDQRMPEVSGTEFLSNVKAMYPGTVRILLSGQSDAATITDAIKRGAVSKYLAKPWDDDDIREQVREAFLAAELC